MKAPGDEEEPMIEDYLDCTGTTRVFRLSLYAEGGFLDAVELRDGEPVGWRFVLPVKAGELPPWGEMRNRIREHLARRDVVRDGEGRFHVLHRSIRAQITDVDRNGEPGLTLLVDDLELSWEELGEALEPYAGWNLHIEIRDVTE